MQHDQWSMWEAEAIRLVFVPSHPHRDPERRSSVAGRGWQGSEQAANSRFPQQYCQSSPVLRPAPWSQLCVSMDLTVASYSRNRPGRPRSANLRRKCSAQPANAASILFEAALPATGCDEVAFIRLIVRVLFLLPSPLSWGEGLGVRGSCLRFARNGKPPPHPQPLSPAKPGERGARKK